MTKVKKEKQKTRSQLFDELGQMAERYADLRGRYDRLNQRVTEAESEKKSTREIFDDLKRRLHDAEVANARLNGYLDRVHEDDIVSDGFVEIEDEKGKRQVPKRPPPMRAAQYMQPDDIHIGRDFYNQKTGRTERRTHWTSY